MTYAARYGHASVVEVLVKEGIICEIIDKISEVLNSILEQGALAGRC